MNTSQPDFCDSMSQEKGVDRSDQVVQQHYSMMKETDRSERLKSKIYHLRSFNNWIKSVLISKCVRLWRNCSDSDDQSTANDLKPLRVMDLGCCKGGDVTKWRKKRPTRIAFVDYCNVALDQCRERYESYKTNPLGFTEAKKRPYSSVEQELSDTEHQCSSMLDDTSSSANPLEFTSAKKRPYSTLDDDDYSNTEHQGSNILDDTTAFTPSDLDQTDYHFSSSEHHNTKLDPNANSADTYTNDNHNTSAHATFHVLDACEDLRSHFEQGEFNLISCQFVVHYMFNKFENVRSLLFNVSYLLESGGLFFGTTTDCFEIMRRWDEAARCGDGGGLPHHSSFNSHTEDKDQLPSIEHRPNIIGNDIYSIDFSKVTTRPPPLFGAEITFKLDELINCPEYLVYFPAFTRMAQDFQLDLIYCRNFMDFYSEYCQKERKLLINMDALKRFPFEDPEENDSPSYAHARLAYNQLNRPNSYIGTLSKEEWQAATIYLCFIFRKR